MRGRKEPPGLTLFFLRSGRSILAAGQNPRHEHRAEAEQRADRERINAPPVHIKSIHEAAILRREGVM